jgi:hypothetical protein
MPKTVPVSLIALFGIWVLPLLGAPATDLELIKNVTLTEYNCEFSTFTTMLFINYKIKNANQVPLYDLTLNYHVEYQDATGPSRRKKARERSNS